MTDVYNLQRFLDAQERVYDAVLDELRAGRKSSHWIWFIFPQLAGLGRSGAHGLTAVVPFVSSAEPAEACPPSPRLRRTPATHSSTALQLWLPA